MVHNQDYQKRLSIFTHRHRQSGKSLKHSNYKFMKAGHMFLGQMKQYIGWHHYFRIWGISMK